HAAGEGGQVVQLVLEPGRDTEIAAATADRPEQVRLVRGVDRQQPPVRGYDLGRQQRVDGEAVLARQVSHATPQRDAADAYRPGVAEADDEVLAGHDAGDLL